jgi:hypothetical protein
MMLRGSHAVAVLLALLAFGLTACGEEHKESAAESAHEAAMEQRHQAAEKRCEAKGEIVAQGNDETTECVSLEQKQREINRGESERSGG